MRVNKIMQLSECTSVQLSHYGCLQQKVTKHKRDVKRSSRFLSLSAQQTFQGHPYLGGCTTAV